MIERLSRLLLVLAVLAMSLLAGAQPVAGQAAAPVFGLRGRLQPVADQPYSTAIETPDGRRSGVVGSTSAVEAKLTDFAARGATVKVWGTMQTQSPVSSLPLIVATTVVEDRSIPRTPARIPSRTPQAGTAATGTAGRATRTPLPAVGPATATIDVYAVYAREGPGGDFTPVGTIARGIDCSIAGRTPDGIWLQLRCPALSGWVRRSFVSVAGDLATVPFVTGPTPTPIVTPTPVGVWRVLGYPNRDLSGTPAISLEAPEVNFDWGTSSPHASLPADNFSLRLDRILRFSPGMHQINLTYDDGARLSLDGQMVINDWAEGAERTSVWQGTLGGDVHVRIDYFDAYGPASLKFETMALQTAVPTSTPIPPLLQTQAPSGSWLVNFYNNIELADPVALSRVEAKGDVYPLNHEFNLDSPVPGVVSEDNWSARWRGRFPFTGGDYRFQARGNEGVRVYIDGVKLIDAWPNSTDTLSNIFRGVGPGEHEITVEMYDAGGPAWVRAWWDAIPADTPTPTLTPSLTPTTALTPTTTLTPTP